MTAGNTGLPRRAVPAAFDVGAAAYDRMVGANPGYHEHLRMSVHRMRIPDRGRGMRLLDAGCGTGASTAALLAAAPKASIVAVDASEGMLRQARSKAWPESVRFVKGRIEELADLGVEGPFDGILAAYLVRNLSDPVNLAGELGGMLVLGYLWRWCDLSSATRRAHVWKTGMLVPVPRRERLQKV